MTDLSVVIDDDTQTVHVDPITGSVTTDQPDGGVVVQLRDHPKTADASAGDFDANLAETMDAQSLARIANDLYDAIGADDQSRQEYLQIRARGFGLLGTKLEEPKSTVGDTSSSMEGMATVTNPLLLEAVLKGWANAHAEMLPADGPVKIKEDGEETTADDDDAEALERGMNHYLTVTASDYYADTSHMLLWGPYFGGSGFKKVYRCPLRERPVSEAIDVKDLIVSDAKKDLRACERITFQTEMRSSVMKRMKLAGAYRDVTLTQPSPETNAVDSKIASIQGVQPSQTRPEDQPHNIWESQCELDIEEGFDHKSMRGSRFKDRGIPLPYLVTMDKDSREILALRRDWSEGDPNCTRKRLYVRFPYVPGPGFYGTGLLNILGNSSAAMTAAWRLALDSGMLANFPSGIIAKIAGRQNSSDMRAGPGQFVPLDTGGLPLKDMIMPNPFHDITSGFMTLIDKISSQAKEVGGTADIPVGEGLQNVPVGTMLANIEQATRIMAAAHKGLVKAMAEELQMLLNLFRRHPEDFWRESEIQPDYWDEQKLLRALDNTKLVPVADPNTPSHLHRVAKALALVQLLAVPQFAPLLNAKEALLRCLRVIREDPTNLVVDPPPQAQQPDPKAIAAQAALTKAQVAGMEAQAKVASAQQDAQLQQAKLATEKDIATVDLSKEMVIHNADQDRLAQQGDLEARQHALDVVKTAHQIRGDQQDRGLEAVKTAHDAAMDHHEAGMAQQEHALNVAQAMKPETPAAKKD